MNKQCPLNDQIQNTVTSLSVTECEEPLDSDSTVTLKTEQPTRLQQYHQMLKDYYANKEQQASDLNLLTMNETKPSNFSFEYAAEFQQSLQRQDRSNKPGLDRNLDLYPTQFCLQG